jgi:2-hydroxycyclohexanecarboxyl-CoA dehydrogenase
VALVTGGGAGIGAATAQLLCSEGAGMMLVDVGSGALARTAKAVLDGRPAARVEFVAADVADAAAAQRAAARCEEVLGRLDVLVNNAAMRNYGALSDATPEAWQAMVGVNMIGSANYCRAVLPLSRRSRRGAIVNVPACDTVTGRKGMGLDDATEAAMLAMTRTLALEESSHGERVNAIFPGSTPTDFHVNRTRAGGTAWTAQDAAAGHLAAGALCGPHGDRMPDLLVGIRRGLVHHRHPPDGGRWPPHQVRAAPLRPAASRDNKARRHVS